MARGAGFDGAARHERGFTLLEVMVAFAIAAVALIIMFKASSGGLLAVATAGRYEEAIGRAKSHLAAIGRDGPLISGTTRGDDGGDYRWRIRIVPLAAVGDSNSKASAFAPVLFRKPVLYSIEVGISWDEGGHQREVLLQTQRIGSPEGGNDG
jgi:general secretion pathway protein I